MSVDDSMESDFTDTESSGDLEPEYVCSDDEIGHGSDSMWTGSYRVYRNDGTSSTWVVDEGTVDTRVEVNEVYIYTSAFSKFAPNEQPEAWFEGYGKVFIADGVAIVEDKGEPTVRTRDNASL